MIEIILGCIVFIALLAIIVVIYHNKFQLAIIKIDEAENNIDILLEKKADLLKRTRPIIQKELKLDHFLDDLETYEEKQLNHFEMHDFLKENYHELFKILDDHEKLLKSETLVSIIEDLNENEEETIGAIKFYNDTVVIFNQLISTFPSNIIGFFCRYKRKEFYNNEKREIYEILNDK